MVKGFGLFRQSVKKIAGGIAFLLLFTALSSPFSLSSYGKAEETTGKQQSLLSSSTLCPGGMPFGSRMTIDGILVVGVTEVLTKDGRKTPAKDSGIREKDLLKSLDGVPLRSAKQLASLLESSCGKTLQLTLLRENEEHQVELTPIASEPDGVYRAGMWVRDNTSGIGTVTVYDPESGAFAGLGHGICSGDGQLLPLKSGEVTSVFLRGVKRSEAGAPGQLQGYLTGETVGMLLGNTAVGVYGILKTEALPRLLKKQAEETLYESPLPLATAADFTEGKASVLCTVGEEGRALYEIELEEIPGGLERDNKNFLVRITDERLLSAIGGIVQGMSGSPILQNGKIIGAITHVRVSDPTTGYGILMENMLSAAG